MKTVAVYRQVRRCWDLDTGELLERKEVVSFFPTPDEKYQQPGKRYAYDGIPRGLLARGKLVMTPTTCGFERKGGETPIVIALPDDAEVFDPIIAPGGRPWRVVEWGKRNLWADELLRLAEAGDTFKIAEVKDGCVERGESEPVLVGPDGGAAVLDGAVSGGGDGDGHHRDIPAISDAARGETVSEDVRPKVSTVADLCLVLAGDGDFAAREGRDFREVDRGVERGGPVPGEHAVRDERHSRGEGRRDDGVLPDSVRTVLRSGDYRLILPPGHRGETDGRKIVVIGGDKHITTSWTMIADSVEDRPGWRLEVVDGRAEPQMVGADRAGADIPGMGGDHQRGDMDVRPEAGREAVAEDPVSEVPEVARPAPGGDPPRTVGALGRKRRRKESKNQLLMF